ncbi:MAG: DUF4494 domain-containing protein [Bacteroidales bacterium]|nr:DUF4494 domain-containing protein [Bacteroidales bacterium]
MKTLFECTVRYSKAMEGTDTQKRVNEVYLFDALTYTEAEKLAYERLQEVISTEFQVTGIRKARYAEVLPNEVGGYWYKVKTQFICVDENNGKEKRVSQMVLTLAENIKDAIERTEKEMGDTPDFMVKAVNESPILDFFPYMSREEVPADREVGRRPATPEELERAKNQK